MSNCRFHDHGVGLTTESQTEFSYVLENFVEMDNEIHWQIEKLAEKSFATIHKQVFDSRSNKPGTAFAFPETALYNSSPTTQYCKKVCSNVIRFSDVLR